MKNEVDLEKDEIQRRETHGDDIQIERPTTADSEVTKSEHHDGESLHGTIEPVVTIGETLGTIDTQSVRRAQSRASSNRSRPLSIVPRSKRRGILGSLTLVPEVENPYDYKNSTKWSLTFIIALATAAAPLGSTIFYPALPVLSRELNASETVVNLSVALYMLSLSIFPLWWSAFSEQFGRRSIYLISFTLFVIFSVASAVSTSIGMLVAFRILGGGASASVQATGAGSIADLFDVFERGRAMSLFYLGPLLGPLIAPIIGGVLTQALGWQASMWFLAIYGLLVLLMITFFLPETLRRKTEVPASQPEDLQRMTTSQSAKVKTKRFAKRLKHYLIDPLGVLLFLRFPPVLITVMLAAITFGSLFVANIAIQQKYSQPPYNYGQLIVGLLYVPPGLGYFMASMFGGPWIDRIMAREARKANRYDENGKLIYLPEDRLRENAWLAITVYPLSLLMFGWTLRYGVHFMVPSIALFFFGVGSMLVFSAATTMLTEFIKKKSSSGVAVNNFVRNILSCVGAVVAAPWINAINVGWVMTILCIFCLTVGYTGIWTLRKNATRWRISMNEALKNM
ncbi:Fc.00g098930.m01.CDS01 [Cosmosporella sp. VM-42]